MCERERMGGGGGGGSLWQTDAYAVITDHSKWLVLM